MFIIGRPESSALHYRREGLRPEPSNSGLGSVEEFDGWCI
jgi:hypothetical protein